MCWTLDSIKTNHKKSVTINRYQIQFVSLYEILKRKRLHDGCMENGWNVNETKQNRWHKWKIITENVSRHVIFVYTMYTFMSCLSTTAYIGLAKHKISTNFFFFSFASQKHFIVLNWKSMWYAHRAKFHIWLMPNSRSFLLFCFSVLYWGINQFLDFSIKAHQFNIQSFWALRLNSTRTDLFHFEKSRKSDFDLFAFSLFSYRTNEQPT